jgi:shikimate kinase
MKIFLIGFMGSGKSVFGKRLARHLNLDFEDLDTLIEEKFKMSVPGIFSQFDESTFRNLETKVLHSFTNQDNFILSCGGGTPCFNNNIDFINDLGISIYIKMPVGALADRLSKSKTKRPLIHDTPPELLIEKIRTLLEKREPIYSQAKIIVDGINLCPEDLIASDEFKRQIFNTE